MQVEKDGNTVTDSLHMTKAERTRGRDTCKITKEKGGRVDHELHVPVEVKADGLTMSGFYFSLLSPITSAAPLTFILPIKHVVAAH
eukprot:2559047-Amphidinium_carterae.1